MILAKKVTDGVLTQVCDGFTDISHLNLLTASAAITECSLYDASMYMSPTNPMTQLVTNGDLSNTVSTEFGAATGWTQTGATMVHSSGTTALTQNLSEASGDLYVVTFTVTGATTSNVTASIGGVNGTARSTNATFSEVFRATGTTDFALTPGNTFDGAVSNIKVYKLGDATNIKYPAKFATVAETKAIDFSDPLQFKKGVMCWVTGTGGECWIYIE